MPSTWKTNQGTYYTPPIDAWEEHLAWDGEFDEADERLPVEPSTDGNNREDYDDDGEVLGVKIPEQPEVVLKGRQLRFREYKAGGESAYRYMNLGELPDIQEGCRTCGWRKGKTSSTTTDVVVSLVDIVDVGARNYKVAMESDEPA